MSEWCTIKEYVAIYGEYTKYIERTLRRRIANGKFRDHQCKEEGKKYLIELTDPDAIDVLKNLRGLNNDEIEKLMPKEPRIRFYCTKWEREVLRKKTDRDNFLAFLEQDIKVKFESLPKGKMPSEYRLLPIEKKPIVYRMLVSAKICTMVTGVADMENKTPSIIIHESLNRYLSTPGGKMAVMRGQDRYFSYHESFFNKSEWKHQETEEYLRLLDERKQQRSIQAQADEQLEQKILEVSLLKIDS